MRWPLIIKVTDSKSKLKDDGEDDDGRYGLGIGSKRLEQDNDTVRSYDAFVQLRFLVDHLFTVIIVCHLQGSSKRIMH